ncbi:MAG: hypothetical protein ACOC3V_05235 [bacterium]
MGNRQIVKYTFENLSKNSERFLNQIFNAETEKVELDFSRSGDIFILHNGIWKNGTWLFGLWKGGMWLDGTWEYGGWHNGTWKDGIWNGGIWEIGKIWNPKTNEYKLSKVSLNNCPWSLSYGK